MTELAKEGSAGDHSRSDTLVRRPMIVRAMFEVLAESSEPLPVTEVLNRVAKKVELTPSELSSNRGGAPRWDTFARFASGWASKVGWLAKRGGWSITEAGLDAFNSFPADQLFRELSRRYRIGYAVERSQRTSSPKDRRQFVSDALALVLSGSWTSFGDLAELADTSPNAIAEFVIDPNTPNTHRVLRADGSISRTLTTGSGEPIDQRALLEVEGVEFDAQGHALAAQHVDTADLRTLLSDLAPPASGQRAWLIRGSSVLGADLVQDWLDRSFVSLAASQLPELSTPATIGDLKTGVDDAYAHLSYASRAEKLDEFRAFLITMQVGDIVATTSQRRIHIGEVSGEATQSRSEDERSNLRWTIDWSEPRSGIAYDQLPDPLVALLKTQRDVVDLTLQIELIKPMLSGAASESSGPNPLQLRDATDGLAQKLLIDRRWLQECIDLLNDRPQLIFYGPPGTGKTFVAQAIAEHVASDAFKLVQFHPSYSYEDFFEGYRPVSRPDGTVGFELRGGPFRTLVDHALENPTVPHVLIIDEINRGNLAKIFGELYFLLEYRDRPIDLLYASGSDKDFTLPSNVFIIGTMNTADRSIALVDSAMRRRFAFVSLHPSAEPTKSLLRSWLQDQHLPERCADLLDELNSRIEDTDFKVGPSYFMRKAVHRDGGLERVWRTAILPLLEEYHFGESVDVQKRYGLATVSAATRADDYENRLADDDDAISAPA